MVNEYQINQTSTRQISALYVTVVEPSNDRFSGVRKCVEHATASEILGSGGSVSTGGWVRCPRQSSGRHWISIIQALGSGGVAVT